MLPHGQGVALPSPAQNTLPGAGSVTHTTPFIPIEKFADDSSIAQPSIEELLAGVYVA